MFFQNLFWLMTDQQMPSGADSLMTQVSQLLNNIDIQVFIIVQNVQCVDFKP